jgi:hypothetical protein
MGKVKKYAEYGVVTDRNGLEHQILIYGELTTEDALRGVRVSDVLYNRHNGQVEKVLGSKVVKTGKSYGATKTLNFGWAICHPNDEFDIEKAVKLCKRRFSKTGISTQDCRFLTDDMVNSILKNELQYVINVKLPEYIQKWEKHLSDKRIADNLGQPCVLKYEEGDKDAYVVYSKGVAKCCIEHYNNGKKNRYMLSSIENPNLYGNTSDLLCCDVEEWKTVVQDIKNVFNIDIVIEGNEAKLFRYDNEITGRFSFVNSREDIL